jgi:nucleoside phosphorylase
MLFLIIALPCEAAPFIERLGLERDVENAQPLTYLGDDCVLVVSGVGKSNAAAATVFALSEYDWQPASVVVANVGICGSGDRLFCIGELSRIDCIRDIAADRSMTLDCPGDSGMVVSHLATYDQPVLRAEDHSGHEPLVDMEGAGFCQAAAMLVRGDRIMCFKVVSDYLGGALPKKAAVSKLIDNHVDEIMSVLDSVSQPSHGVLE